MTFFKEAIISPDKSEMTDNMLKTRDFFYKKCFLDVIGKNDLLKMTREYMLVAGGSVLDYYINKKITNDFDIYFDEYDSMKKYLEKIEENEHEIISHTSKAILLKQNGYLYHLIHPNFISSNDAFKTFDFNICCLGVDHRNNFLYEKTAIYSINEKNILLNNIMDPLSTFKRLQKYIKKGFEIKNDYVFFKFIDTLYNYYNSPEYKNKIISRY